LYFYSVDGHLGLGFRGHLGLGFRNFAPLTKKILGDLCHLPISAITSKYHLDLELEEDMMDIFIRTILALTICAPQRVV
jgi:hypothetical protein